MCVCVGAVLMATSVPNEKLIIFAETIRFHAIVFREALLDFSPKLFKHTTNAIFSTVAKEKHAYLRFAYGLL